MDFLNAIADFIDPIDEDFQRAQVQQQAPQPVAATPPLASKSKPGGGTVYAVSKTPSGRLKTEQLVKQTEKTNNPLLDVESIMSPKTYARDINDSDFVHAPNIDRAFGIDPTTEGWGGLRGKGMQIGMGLLSRIAPVVAGGLVGGRKGAQEALGKSQERQEARDILQRKQSYDVSSDRVMREAYEVARMNYEADYNNGKMDRPFGDYLSEAMEAVQTKYSGTLGTLTRTYGKDEGLDLWKKSQNAYRTGGGGGGVATDTYTVVDDEGVPHTVRRKVSSENLPTGAPAITTTDKDGVVTVRAIKAGGKKSLGDFNR